MDVDIRRNVDDGESASRSFDGKVVEEVVRVPHGRAQPPRAVPALAMVLLECGLTWLMLSPHISSIWKSKV